MSPGVLAAKAYAARLYKEQRFSALVAVQYHGIPGMPFLGSPKQTIRTDEVRPDLQRALERALVRGATNDEMSVLLIGC